MLYIFNNEIMEDYSIMEINLEEFEEIVKEVYIIVTTIAYLNVFPIINANSDDIGRAIVFFLFGAWWSYRLGALVLIPILKVLHLFLYYFSSYFKISTNIQRKYNKLY